MYSMRDQDIFMAVRRVLAGDMDIDAFEDRMGSDAWDQDSSLAREVWGILTETAGNTSNDRVMELLGQLVAPNVTVVDALHVGPPVRGVISAGLPSPGTTTSIPVLVHAGTSLLGTASNTVTSGSRT